MKQSVRAGVVLAMVALLTVFQPWNGLGFAERAVGAGDIVDRIIGLVDALGFGEYEVGADEIALYIQLDTREDIGLLVYDYRVDGRDYGGGISNADKSPLKHVKHLLSRRLHFIQSTMYLLMLRFSTDSATWMIQILRIL